MNRLRTFIAIIALSCAMGGSFNTLNADYCSGDYRGCGYEDCCTAPCISPTVALGTVAVVAVVAVIIHNNNSHGSHHNHYHSD